MTSYNIPNPKGFIVFVLFIATLMWVSFIMSGCKNKQVQCEAYSKAQNKIADSLVFNVADFKKEDNVTFCSGLSGMIPALTLSL